MTFKGSPRSPWLLPRGMHPSKAIRIGSAPERSRTIVAASRGSRERARSRGVAARRGTLIVFRGGAGQDGGVRRLPARNLPYNPLSTTRRKPGILMDVHPVLPRIAEASQLQLPRPGPDGQPTESSQLGVSHTVCPRAFSCRRHQLGRLLQPPRRRSHWLCCSPPASLPSPAMIRWDKPCVVLGAQPDGCKEHLDLPRSGI